MCMVATVCLGRGSMAPNNFATLATLDWQVHVYGAARAELAAWCAAQKLPLHVFDWRPAHVMAGLGRDALYLLRPDTYVALADGAGSPSALDRYFAERGIRLHRPQPRI